MSTRSAKYELVPTESFESDILAKSDAEKSPFLGSLPLPTSSRAKGVWHLSSYILNVILILLLIILLKSPRASDPSIGYSPAKDSVSYKTVQFNDGFGNDTTPYQGLPTDELDALWEDMYDRGIGLHLSPDEVDLDQLPNYTEKVPLPGLEDQFLIGLDVFHQLHCLNKIRKSFYPDRYNSSIYLPNGTLDFMPWMHMDHCVEIIRQRLLCTSDVTVSWYRWRADKTPPFLSPKIGAPHTCRDFSAVREWAFDRWVEDFPVNSRVVDGKIVDYS